MKLLTRIKQWLSILAGSPQVQIEDYVLEHLLAYHGLVGTAAAENQPELAGAIANAIEQRSTAQLAAVLQIPPLWWDEHLNPIFEEIARREPLNLAAVLTAEDSPESDLLSNDDWRVCANAANALALLCTWPYKLNDRNHQTQEPDAGENRVQQAEKRLAGLLSKCRQDPFKPAFMHVACAVAKLGTDSACLTLLGYLHDDEPWFRVDAVKALTYFPAQKTAARLLINLPNCHPLLDYAATVITRAYDMRELSAISTAGDTATKEGFCELALGILQAAKQLSFGEAVVQETGAVICLPELLKLDALQSSPRRIRAVLQLSDWLEHNQSTLLYPPQIAEKLDTHEPHCVTGVQSGALYLQIKEKLTKFKRELESAEFIELMKTRLKDAALSDLQQDQPRLPDAGHESLLSSVIRHDQTDMPHNHNQPGMQCRPGKHGTASDIKHTVVLTGELHLQPLVAELIALLNPEFIAVEEAVTALGRIGDVAAVQPLIRLTEKLVDIKRRTQLPPQAQPVFESNPGATNTYWLVLDSLGRLPHPDSLAFLIQSAYDFAPDKRAQALQSLIKVCAASGGDQIRHFTETTVPSFTQPLENETSLPRTVGYPVAGTFYEQRHLQLEIQPEIKKLLEQTLKDPSPEVRKVALRGVAKLYLPELLPMVRKNCGAKERSLSEEAFGVFQKLHAQGLSEPVLRELKRGAAWTLNSNLRQRYAQLAAALAG